MAASELMIDGKRYVSSSRAAELIGYTKDYVGQLARAGKVDCQMIGRSWYVSEESIQKHKLGVHYTLTKPKKPRKSKAEQSERSDEKTSKNIDISEPVPLSRHTEVVHSTLQHVVTPSQPVESSIDSSRHTDALLQSDIRYRTEEPLHFDDADDAVVAEQREHLGTPDTPPEPEAQRINIRVPRARLRSAQAQHPSVSGVTRPATRQGRHSGSAASIDGVGVGRTVRSDTVRRPQTDQSTHDQIRMPSAEQHYQEGASYAGTQIGTESDILQPTRQRPKEPRSKAVPVLGGLVVLAAFVLVYLLVR